MTRIGSMAVVGAVLLPAVVAGQGTLASRIAAVRDGEVQFEYASREDACGDGRSFIRVGENSINGNWSEGENAPCTAGPVRVVVRKSGGDVTGLHAYVGPVTTAAGRTELGEVSPNEGANYLLDVAANGPARASREAVFPAMLGRGVIAWPALLRIAHSKEGRARQGDVNFWLSRYAAAKLQGSDDPFSVDRQPDNDEEDVKKHAVFALSQLGGHEGIDPLIQVARTNKDAVVRAQALFWLGQSGDPRAVDLFDEILNGRVAPPRG